MKYWMAAILVLLASPAIVGAGAADGPEGAAGNNWLMMVTTENTEPSKESEFNDWYNAVDIPDVLRVPGYVRARRGQEQRDPESATAHSTASPIKYVALYDIRSRDIDKTIIDMLMASWGMEKAHHSTDLLKVTERVYFRQYGPTYGTRTAKPAAANEYIYMARVDCCRDAVAEGRFDRWYRSAYVPAFLSSAGSISVTRYKLYRVLMDKPVKIPNFLDIYEIDANSAAQAMQAMRTVANKLSGANRMNESIAEGSRSLFLKIKDVKRH